MSSTSSGYSEVPSDLESDRTAYSDHGSDNDQTAMSLKQRLVLDLNHTNMNRKKKV